MELMKLGWMYRTAEIWKEAEWRLQEKSAIGLNMNLE
jgi:Nucleotidyltransferase/DNA polymerase involved in DNA repair